jgi:hypothetical protein
LWGVGIWDPTKKGILISRGKKKEKEKQSEVCAFVVLVWKQQKASKATNNSLALQTRAKKKLHNNMILP